MSSEAETAESAVRNAMQAPSLLSASEFFAVGKPNEGPCNVLTQCCCPCGKPLGNMVVLAESRAANGEIRLDCVVGPFWPVMLFVTFPLVVGISLIVAVTCLPALNPGFAVGMVVLMLATAIALGKTATTDPGILHRHHEKPEGTNWIYSDQAETFRPRGAMYCSECNVIIEEYDHVCPWTGTGIGKGNMPWFQRFTTLVCLLIIYAVFIVLFKIHQTASDDP